jgi:pimeloyl-ACP methyl ester carboxylesterase
MYITGYLALFVPAKFYLWQNQRRFTYSSLRNAFRIKYLWQKVKIPALLIYGQYDEVTP